MAENDRRGRPPPRRPATGQSGDTGRRKSRDRQQRQRGQEARQEQPDVAQPAREEDAAQQPAQPTLEEMVSPGPGGEETQGVATGEGPPPEQAEVTAEAPLMPARFEGETPEMAEVTRSVEGVESGEAGRRERHRTSQNNALGLLIEQHFEDPTSPVRSYSDLERRSRISREALSRYVTTRSDRRRSPTIDSLVAIADAMHLSLESVARAAAAAAKGFVPPPEDVQQRREDLVRMPVAALSDEQFNAVLELLIQMRPLGPGASGSRRFIPQI
ncbi:MAG TPA: helix-turn-helix transcriptional regulator [Ktedonobacterales bacterium]